MKKAKVLVGNIRYVGLSFEPYFENCFSLYIDKELVYTDKKIEYNRVFRDNCKEVGKEITILLEKEGIDEYLLINGKRTRSEGLRIIDCESVSKNNLRELVSNIKAKNLPRIIDRGFLEVRSAS